MKIVERKDLDVVKWDALVSRFPEASFFSFSWYLDAVAENWCVLVDDQYQNGIALPYTKRMSVEILYIPIFGRFVTPLGAIDNVSLESVKERFSVREIATSHKLFEENTERVHQIIPADREQELSSQGKRSLSKARKSGIQFSTTKDYGHILAAIRSEIEGKFDGVDATSVDRLGKLFENASEKGVLAAFEVELNGEKGGIVCLENAHELLYLKGACPENLKQSGGMYVALNEAIRYAKERNLHFDFGGSNVKGVQRFNKNLGGIDKSYYFHEYNDGPVLFKLARKLKKSVG